MHQLLRTGTGLEAAPPHRVSLLLHDEEESMERSFPHYGHWTLDSDQRAGERCGPRGRVPVAGGPRRLTG